MGVRKTGRCSIVVDGREYVWWFEKDGAVFRIASADKRFVIGYELHHAADAAPSMRVVGPEFAGVAAGRGLPVFVRPPAFDLGRGWKALARQIVRWCLRRERGGEVEVVGRRVSAAKRSA